MKNLKYSEILRQNQSLEKASEVPVYKVSVLSNITIHQSKEIIELMLRKEGINAVVTLGNYDNLVQDSVLHNQSDVVILFWELSNIVEGLQYKIRLLSSEDIENLVDKVSSEIDLVIKNLQFCPLILCNKFSALAFSTSTSLNDSFDVLGKRLNNYLESKQVTNLTLVDIDQIIAFEGVGLSIDLRYYASSKALYTIAFFKAYAHFVKPYLMAVNGKAKKVFVFDCDNTLWHGILGEDGFDGIDMSEESPIGRHFQEVQSIVLSLRKQGVLLALCSKNNAVDVDLVLETHPDMLIRQEDLAIKKVNWVDKAENIRSMSKELNLGLDSFVFVDDSDFEVNFVLEQLPQVEVLQVPSKLYLYPQMLRENMWLFYCPNITKEDADRTYFYKSQVAREAGKSSFADIEEYLASLDIIIQVFKNHEPHLSRMAQLSQKTNQFNLTTRRYTESDIHFFIQSDDIDIYSFTVSDRYGDSGVTGLCVLRQKNNDWVIDSLLMSCRVLGRNIEHAFINYLVAHLRNKNVDLLCAEFVETTKNIQVAEFYDQCGFELCNKGDLLKDYVLKLDGYLPQQISYIEVVHES